MKNGDRLMYTGIRYGPWTYVRGRIGTRRCTTGRTDRGELTNLAGRKRHREMLIKLRSLNRQYRDCAGANCPMELDPHV